jgi:hypothetical protein
MLNGAALCHLLTGPVTFAKKSVIPVLDGTGMSAD